MEPVYYEQLKLEARNRAASQINTFIEKKNISGSWGQMLLKKIDRAALDFAAEVWPDHYPDDFKGFPYSWNELYRRFSYRTSFFDLAIWQNKDGKLILQGLILGKPSRGKTHLTIFWVERLFGSNYFRGGILIPALDCAEQYACLLGCERVLIKNPIDVTKYERLGYSVSDTPPNSSATYLLKDIGVKQCHRSMESIALT